MPTDWTTSTLGDRVHEVCRRRGWSLNRLGVEAAVESGPMSRLSRHEEHIGGSPAVLARIARAGGVCLDWLVDGTGPVELPGGIAPGSLPILRNRVDWPALCAAVLGAHRSLPVEALALAGEAMIPHGVAIDPPLIYGMARELYDAHGRAARGEPDETARLIGSPEDAQPASTLRRPSATPAADSGEFGVGGGAAFGDEEQTGSRRRGSV